MTRPLRVLFHPGNAVHVDMALELRTSLERLGHEPSLHGFELDDWYALGARAALERAGLACDSFGAPVHEGPRLWALSDPTRTSQDAYPRLVEEFRAAVLTRRPDLFMLFADEGLFEAGMLSVCRELELPTVLIQEGYRPEATSRRRRFAFLPGRPKHRFEEAPAGFPKLRPFGLNGAVYLGAVNEEDRAHYIRSGFDADHVALTGHVLMDRLFRYVHKRGAGVTNASGGRDVLYVSSGQGHFGRTELQRAIASAVRELDEQGEPRGVRVALRLKPGERLDDWLSTWPAAQRALVPNDRSIYEQISEADIVIASGSQALVEALALRKPAIDLRLQGREDPFGLVRSGAARGVGCGEEALEAVLASPLEPSSAQMDAWHGCYEKCFYRFDGEAASRAAALLARAAGRLPVP